MATMKVGHRCDDAIGRIIPMMASRYRHPIHRTGARRIPYVDQGGDGNRMDE